jgi:MSHA pilin protein MshC
MNLFRRKSTGSRGFTLIEAIAVLIILGIVAAVAASRAMTGDSDLVAQEDTVKTHLRFAQLKALADDTAASWGISFSGASYTLNKNGSAAAINLPGEDSGSHTFPTGVTASGAAAVNFDPWGSPGTSNVTVTLSQAGVPDRTITITAYTGHIP